MTKGIAILLVTIAALYFAYVIITIQPPKEQEYEEYGDYFK